MVCRRYADLHFIPNSIHIPYMFHTVSMQFPFVRSHSTHLPLTFTPYMFCVLGCCSTGIPNVFHWYSIHVPHVFHMCSMHTPSIPCLFYTYSYALHADSIIPYVYIYIYIYMPYMFPTNSETPTFEYCFANLKHVPVFDINDVIQIFTPLVHNRRF